MFFMPTLAEIFPSPRLLGAPRLFGSLEYVRKIDFLVSAYHSKLSVNSTLSSYLGAIF